MIESLIQSHGRLLAVALLLLVLAGVGFGLGLPVWSANHYYQVTIDEMEAKLERYRGMAAVRARLMPRYQQLQRRQAQSGEYLSSTSEALAAAELQRLAKQFIVPNGGKLLSTQIVPAVQEEGYTRVAIRVRLRGPLDSLVAAFHALESGKPYLFLNRVSIRSWSTGRRGPVARQVGLNADFELAGYMPGGGDPS